MRRSILPLAVTLLCGACASSRSAEPSWIYGVSRAIYSDLSDTSKSPRADPSPQDSAPAFIFALAIPIALDTVLLPITIPHDLLFVK